jgi:hypothetical protein
MQIRVIDFDGGVAYQTDLAARHQPETVPAQTWGPQIRLACSHRRFRRLERALAILLGTDADPDPALTFCGSGDFHHVTLALLRRLRTSVNLLVLDNHPDWMRGVPFLHCGTWLYHAAWLPHVHRIIHVGGDVDFDNYYRWMAPWHLLRSGKITVFPSVRTFRSGFWSEITNRPLRLEPGVPVSADRVVELLMPFRAELASLPIYISLDKDVLVEQDAVVNWDSGHLCLAEVCAVVNGFIGAARANLAGMDVVGDWSPVRLRGWLRQLMHVTEHPALAVDIGDATRRNERTNLELIDNLLAALASARGPTGSASA